MSNNLDAEFAVIGSILQDPSCVGTVEAIITPDDMSLSLHQQILKTVYVMRADGEAVDPVTLIDRIPDINSEYISHLVNLISTVTNVAEYAQIVKAASMARRLKDLGAYLFEDSEDPLSTFAEANKRLEEIQQGIKSSVVSSFDSCMNFNSYRSELEKSAESIYVKTGFTRLDELLGGGLLNEGLYIVGARPGMGKTTFSLVVAENIAQRKEPVLFVTLEMSEKQLTAKRVARISSIPSNVVLMGKLGNEEYTKVGRALAELSVRPLYTNFKAYATVSDIGAMASSIKGIRCVVVDYLGLIRPSERRKSRYEETTEISGSLKALARRLKLPILCLAQLNRSNEQSQSKKPQLSGLRDTGAIEQDADGVIFLHRDDYYADQKGNSWDAKELEVILAKNRHGETGKVTMAFYPSVSKITT